MRCSGLGAVLKFWSSGYRTPIVYGRVGGFGGSRGFRQRNPLLSRVLMIYSHYSLYIYSILSIGPPPLPSEFGLLSWAYNQPLDIPTLSVNQVKLRWTDKTCLSPVLILFLKGTLIWLGTGDIYLPQSTITY